jgi:hypothetical protein
VRRAGTATSAWGACLGIVLLLGVSLTPQVSAQAAPPAPTVLMAAPLGGGDTCTQSAPCSLLGAQAAARRLSPHLRADLEVSLENGTYDLTRPMQFGPQDSGTNGFTVTYAAAAGAHPVISGGVAVTRWHQVDPAKHIWAAPIAPGFDTRQLYVNGQSMPRSAGLPSAAYVQTSTGFISSSPVLAHWRNVTNVSAVFTGGNGAWTQPSCTIASVSGDTITMSEPCWQNLHLPGDGSQEVSWVYGPQGGFGGLSGAAMPSFFQNAYELLSPGHWSIDTTMHQLFYVPAPGQDMATATFLVPVLQTLFNVAGTLAAPVHDLTFAGLQFSYGTWTQPDTTEGFAEMQADWTLTGAGAAATQGTCSYSLTPGTCPYASWTRTPANVVLSATHHVTMEGDTFSHLGGAGLDVEYGSQDDVVEGNEFTDIAASAIQLGSTDDPLPADVGAGSREIDSNDTIADNYIHDVANEYLGGVGIWQGYAQHATIAHNQIDDVPYTAISIGWAGWHSNVVSPDADPNVNSDNLIADNLMFNYMQTLGDGGAIYTNGGQANGWGDELVISGNVAYGGTNTDFSLYTDTGSKYVNLTNNVVYDQPVDSFASGGCHTVGHIRLSDNYFSQLGPLYPCDAVIDVVATGTTPVCTNLEPDQAPSAMLAAAGIEPAWRSLLVHQVPLVADVGPTALPLSGGLVLVSGSGFTPSTTVEFGTVPARSVTVLSANYLEAEAPPGSGNIPVALSNGNGTSAPGPASIVRFSANPAPCLPLVGGNFSTALAP